MAVPTTDGLLKWKSRRRVLRRWWWSYLIVAVVGVAWFIHNLTVGEPAIFAALLLIPLIALRQAWKTDRQIVACDRRLHEFGVPPTMPSHNSDA